MHPASITTDFVGDGLGAGSALLIVANDPAKQRAAWELMKYLISGHGYTVIQGKIGYLPLRPGIVDDPKYFKDWVAGNPLGVPNLKPAGRVAAVGRFPWAKLRLDSHDYDEGRGDAYGGRRQ